MRAPHPPARRPDPLDDDAKPDLTLAPHADRQAIVAEMHTRPAPRLEAPVRVSHLAMLSGRTAASTERRLIGELCAAYGALPPGEHALHHVARLGELELRWERHTEFSTLMLLRGGAFEQPFLEPPLALLPERWLQRLPGQLVEASHIAIIPADQPPPDRNVLAHAFEGHHLMGGRISGEQVRIWTSLRVHGDGFGRVLIQDGGFNPTRLGRLVQRVLELETYRLMALLGLAAARRLMPTLDEMEQVLVELTVQTARIRDAAEERLLLDRLTGLAAEHARHSSDIAYRFGATRAYAELVHERLGRLRLEREGDLEQLSAFLERRFEPAMRTCRSVEERMESLGQRIGRAADLLRTRVDLALQEQNQSLLTSMDERAKLQLRLQQTVEGLSVAAISYYLLGLLSYVLKASAIAIGPMVADIVLALAVPLVVFGVWRIVRRIRRKLGH
ncbi:MAG: DUF3422 family protein [Geminicoccaceae bacterium]|nr:MAG: DUF3422 family protein [Geminicoccaceae bacterium]